jgi:hypothetical protein
MMATKFHWVLPTAVTFSLSLGIAGLSACESAGHEHKSPAIIPLDRSKVPASAFLYVKTNAAQATAAPSSTPPKVAPAPSVQDAAQPRVP